METMLNNGIKHLDSKLDEVLRLLKAKNRLAGETILDNQDLCMMLNLSKRSLQRYRSEKLIQYFMIGGKIFYLESEVQKFIESYNNKASEKEEDTAAHTSQTIGTHHQ